MKLPETREEFCVWALEQPQNQSFIYRVQEHCNYLAWNDPELHRWIVDTIENFPDLVYTKELKCDQFYYQGNQFKLQSKQYVLYIAGVHVCDVKRWSLFYKQVAEFHHATVA